MVIKFKGMVAALFLLLSNNVCAMESDKDPSHSPSGIKRKTGASPEHDLTAKDSPSTTLNEIIKDVWLLLSSNEYEKAIGILKNAQDAYPKETFKQEHATIDGHLGIVYARQAIQRFEECFSNLEYKSPYYSLLLQSRARFFAQSQCEREAVQDFKAIIDDPSTTEIQKGEAFHLMGQTYYMSGQNNSLEAYLNALEFKEYKESEAGQKLIEYLDQFDIGPTAHKRMKLISDTFEKSERRSAFDRASSFSSPSQFSPSYQRKAPQVIYHPAPLSPHPVPILTHTSSSQYPISPTLESSLPFKTPSLPSRQPMSLQPSFSPFSPRSSISFPISPVTPYQYGYASPSYPPSAHVSPLFGQGNGGIIDPNLGSPLFQSSSPVSHPRPISKRGRKPKNSQPSSLGIQQGLPQPSSTFPDSSAGSQTRKATATPPSTLSGPSQPSSHNMQSPSTSLNFYRLE